MAPVPTDVQLADVDAKAISVADLDGNMMMAHSPPVDILIRTSGVHRLSDFLLWQVRRTGCDAAILLKRD